MTIQNNTTKINTIKNTTLPELLQKINSLPDAGSGGGSVEMCTVTVDCPSKLTEKVSLYYSDGTSTYIDHNIEWRSTVTISVVKNSIVFTYGTCTIASSGNVQVIHYDGDDYFSAFFVVGDCTLTFEM